MCSRQLSVEQDECQHVNKKPKKLPQRVKLIDCDSHKVHMSDAPDTSAKCGQSQTPWQH